MVAKTGEITTDELGQIVDESYKKLNKESYEAYKDYQYWKAKDTPTIEQVVLLSGCSLMLSMLVFSFLPESMLFQTNGRFPKTIVYDITSFLTTMFYLLYRRSKNGANYSALVEAETVAFDRDLFSMRLVDLVLSKSQELLKSKIN